MRKRKAKEGLEATIGKERKPTKAFPKDHKQENSKELWNTNLVSIMDFHFLEFTCVGQVLIFHEILWAVLIMHLFLSSKPSPRYHSSIYYKRRVQPTKPTSNNKWMVLILGLVWLLTARHPRTNYNRLVLGLQDLKPNTCSLLPFPSTGLC